MKTSELNLNTSVRTTMKNKRWNQDLSPTRKLLQPFGQGPLWSVGSKKELWDSRKHRTWKEAGEEEMPKGSHPPSTNMGGSLPPNGTLLSHHAQPFIPSSLHMPTGLVPIHIGNPPAGGILTYHPQGGIYHRLSPTMAYLHTMGLCSFADSIGSVTPFVRWIEDYPLPDGLKMPSHIGSYDGKGDPDNFLHLFKGAIRMQKWLMLVACHMFTYTLKDSARICQQKKFTKTHLAVHNINQREGESTRAFITRYTDDTLQILGLHEEQHISRFVHRLRTRNLVEHLSTDLSSTYKGLMKKPTRGSKQEKWRPMELLMIEGKILKDQENPLGKITKDRRAGIGSPYTEDLTTDCAPTCLKAHERSLPQKRHLKASNSLLIEEAVKSGQLSHLVKGIKKERDESYTKNKFEDLTSESKKITFPSGGSNSSAPVVIKAKFFGREVNRVHMDSGSSCESIGKITLEITIGDAPLTRKETLDFMIVKSDFPYNKLLGRIAMQKMEIVVSTIHGAIKFHTTRGIGTVFSTHESDKIKEGMKKVRETPPVSEKGVFSCTTTEEKVVANNKYPEQTVAIGKQLPEHFKGRLRDLLRANADVFAWTHANMTGIPRTITVKGNPFNTEHKLNEYSHVKPIKQKRRVLGPDRSTAACKEVEELTKIQMAEGDEDKTAFFAGEGVFCYRKMPFGLKNAGATYQRLVDKVFHDQIGRNLEAYVDDMVIKSTSEEEMLADIKETFEKFRSINMKLNPKKCSFGVEKGPFLGHLITKKGIRVNPSKVKAITNVE
ncbi:reverse transcriptase domain-containing protein [Tanacetum coccineum]|uniref:Reverse transcriptase domain-containing protein n=1 Tax=Tanacetum coccineum TaxID=301880 RepID=A0ABQ5GWQ1_9ASTR